MLRRRPYLLLSPFIVILGAALALVPAAAQQAYLTPNENLVVDGVPPIPAALAATAGRYLEYRAASLDDWHPLRREMLISTRFGDTSQLHLVARPGGARRQLTFFADAVSGGRFHPNGGDYIVFSKDIGGGEWYQLYRYDEASGDVTLLTDGKSRNSFGAWSSGGNQIAYVSTRRTGKDTDLWVMNPADPKTDLLLLEYISINESYLWLVDATTGEKTELTPRHPAQKISYAESRFSKDGKGIYTVTDKDSEFRRLAFLDLTTQKSNYLTTAIPWDVESFDLSRDGAHIAFVTDEDGADKLHILDTASGKQLPVPKLPVGVISGLHWRRSAPELGFTMNSA